MRDIYAFIAARRYSHALSQDIEEVVMKLMNKYAKDKIDHIYGYNEIFKHVRDAYTKVDNNLLYHTLTHYTMPHLVKLGQVQRLDYKGPVMFKHLKKEYIFRK